MSIIKCPECGHQISDKAPTCPNCGVEIAGKIIRCRECGEVYLDDEDLCPHCHCPAPNQHTIIETRDIKHKNNTNIPAAPAASVLASTAFTNEKEKPAAKIADKNETTARPTEQPAAQKVRTVLRQQPSPRIRGKGKAGQCFFFTADEARRNQQ